MKRILLTAALALFISGFHEWTPAHAAGGTCYVESQFGSTYSQDDATNWIVGVSGPTVLGASCSTNWRVEFKPQYRQNSSWHLGINEASKLCEPNEGCGTPTYYAANQYQTFTPAVSPPAFTGYWDNGDGTPPRPVCAYHWRVHESFFNQAGVKLLDAYSPSSPITCSVPMTRRPPNA